MDQNEEVKKKNNKKAAEFVRRLIDGNFPQCDIAINYKQKGEMKKTHGT